MNSVMSQNKFHIDFNVHSLPNLLL